MDYKSAGVDVNAGYQAVERIKSHAEKTLNHNVLSGLGGFGGFFSLKDFMHMKEPILVSGTDGVGTKLKIAFLADKHDTIGIDCVAMCANDIICSGAKPLYFLDYIACGKNDPEKIESIVSGIAEGCKQAGMALVGGETAEMPGFYPDQEYDVAGFAVGIVDKEKIIDGRNIKEGDVLIGLASNGLHSNGFSLVRKVLRPSSSNYSVHIESLGSTLGEVLLKPTRIYVKAIQYALENLPVKGIANITGGGFIENIPRMAQDAFCYKIEEGAWPVHPIFALLESSGNIEHMNMYNIFNMGIGMLLAVDKNDADDALTVLKDADESAYIIGEVTKGEGVRIC